MRRTCALLLLCVVWIHHAACQQNEESGVSRREVNAALEAIFGKGNRARKFARREAPKDAFPFVVGLRERKTLEHLCTATLISRRWAITAASCILPAEADGFLEDGSVYVGGVDLDVAKSAELIPVQSYVTHPKYETSGGVHDPRFDVALVKLSRETSVKPIRLPAETDGCCEDLTLLNIGWPSVSFKEPREEAVTVAAFPYLPFRKCSRVLDMGLGDFAVGEAFTVDSSICVDTGDNGWCVDDGSPLVLHTEGTDVLVGLASTATQECGFEEPFLFTRLAPLVPWMLAVGSVRKDIQETWDSSGHVNNELEEPIAQALTGSVAPVIPAGPDPPVAPIAQPLAGSVPTTQIATGDTTIFGQQPYIVSIRHNDNHDRVGILLRSRWVLTSSADFSPFISNSELLAYIGGVSIDPESGEGETKTIIDRFIHPSLDVMLLRLKQRVQSAPVKRMSTKPIAPVGEFVNIYGWGRLGPGQANSPTLQVGQIPLAEDAECRDLKDSMVCMGDVIQGARTCQGDLGAPLVEIKGNRTTFMGIKADVIDSSGCDMGPVPFVSAHAIRRWIQDTIRSV